MAGDAELSRWERALLDGVEETLRGGVRLVRWWRRTEEEGSYARRFPLLLEGERPVRNHGFLDEVPLGHRVVPVMGAVQDLFYDRCDGSAEAAAGLRALREQLREFVLRYLMRVAPERRRKLVAEAEPRAPSILDRLSWCPEETPEHQGYGFTQVFYRRRGSRKIGRFGEGERYAVVDLRELAERYDWVVLKVRPFDFGIAVQPFGDAAPWLELPLNEEVHVVICGDLVTDRTAAGAGAEGLPPGVLGEYGFAYALLPDPEPDPYRTFAYSPATLAHAFDSFSFRVRGDGEVWVRHAWAAEQPERLLNLDPLGWGLDLADRLTLGTASVLLAPVKETLERITPTPAPVFNFVALANLATLGRAGKDLAISRERVLKALMAQQVRSAHRFLLSTLPTWHRVPDWRAPESDLPEWARRGKLAVARAAAPRWLWD